MLKVHQMNGARYWWYNDLSREEYWIDVYDCGDMFEAWYMPVNYGIAELMFGIPKEQENGNNVDYDMFMEMVITNADDYINRSDFDRYEEE